MRSKRTLRITVFTALIGAVSFAGFPDDASAQGRGKGNGQRGGDRRAERKVERPNKGGGQDRRANRPDRQQRQPQQRQAGGNNRQNNARVQNSVRRQQPQARQQPVRQQRQERRSQERPNAVRGSRQDRPQIVPAIRSARRGNATPQRPAFSQQRRQRPERKARQNRSSAEYMNWTRRIRQNSARSNDARRERQEKYHRAVSERSSRQRNASNDRRASRVRNVQRDNSRQRVALERISRQRGNDRNDRWWEGRTVRREQRRRSGSSGWNGRDVRNDRRDDRRNDVRRGRDRNRSVWGVSSPWRYKNYGQYRSAQVHARNEARRSARYDRDSYNYRNYGRDHDRYYDDDTRYQVIRNIVFDRAYSRYDPYRSYNYGSVYYDTPYEPVYGSPYVVNYVYYGVPASYGYGSNQQAYNVPQYGGYYDPYAYTPTYTSYASYVSYPDYGYDAEYSAYDPYDNGSMGGFGSLLGAVPVGEIVSEITGNSVIGELLGGFLNQGYDEGYLAGEYARDNGFADEGYYDPYYVSDTNYDTYSLNLAENRRIFSEGYETGYRDALEERNAGYQPFYDSEPDLVSLLLGNVLSGA